MTHPHNPGENGENDDTKEYGSRLEIGQAFDVNELLGGIVTKSDVGNDVQAMATLNSERGKYQLTKESETGSADGLPFVIHKRADCDRALADKRAKCVKASSGADRRDTRLARCIMMLIDKLTDTEVLFRDLDRVELQATFSKQYPNEEPLTDFIFNAAFRELCKSKYGDRLYATPEKKK